MIKQSLQIYVSSGIALYGLAAISSVQAQLGPDDARAAADSASRQQPPGKNLTINPALDLTFSRRWYFPNPIELIKPTCSAYEGPTASTFIITGRGGLPDNPSDMLKSDTVWSDLRPLTQRAEIRLSSVSATPPTIFNAEQLMEVQGWMIGNKGEVVLTATTLTVTPRIPWMNLPTCYAPIPNSL